MDTDYVINEMKRGRGTQFDPDALDAFFRLIDKGIINPDELYAQKSAEIKQADKEAHEELARRVEEDKKIQAAQMQDAKDGDPKPEASKGEAAKPEASESEGAKPCEDAVEKAEKPAPSADNKGGTV